MKSIGRSARVFLPGLLALLALAGAFSAAAVAGEQHRLVLQVSDDDPVKMRSALDIAANVSRHYTAQGAEAEIVVIAFAGGIDMLLADRSPVRDRMLNFVKAMPNVAFKACGNTLDGVTAREGRPPPLLPDVEVVPTGVAAIMEHAEKGWVVVRP